MSKKNTASFEEQMKRLQFIVQELERADLPLEENVALYKEGRQLALSCKELLDKAKNELFVNVENGSDFSAQDFMDLHQDTLGKEE